MPAKISEDVSYRTHAVYCRTCIDASSSLQMYGAIIFVALFAIVSVGWRLPDLSSHGAYRMSLYVATTAVKKAAILLPIYNKILFSGLAQLPWLPPAFNYPLMATTLQLSGVTLICVVVWIGERMRAACKRRAANEMSPARLRTLIVHVTLPAITFAAVIGLSNVGLSQVGVNLHVLLRSSEVRFATAQCAHIILSVGDNCILWIRV
jgi:hypothetical protein